MGKLIKNAICGIWEFLHCSFAPAILFVVMLITDSIFHNIGAFELKAVCNVVFTIGMILSFALCFSEFGKTGKWILIALCVFSAFNAYENVEYMGTDQTENGPSYTDISFTGSSHCSGCFGRGYITCNASHCVKGRCTACTYGSYNYGTYRSSCRVCGGDGLCNRCDGTNMVECRVCH